MKTNFLPSVLLLLSLNVTAQTDTSFIETNVSIQTKTCKVYGTLCTPEKFDKIPVVLIIAGSGPTDRDGNNKLGVKCDAYKILAHNLCVNHIASVRYDKRFIGESKDTLEKLGNMRFEDFVNDASEWVAMLKKDKRFSKVIVIGHSEGSLIGMIAAQKNADEYISLAGIGQTADKTLKMQLSTLPKGLQDSADNTLDSLAKGKLVKKVPVALYSLFNPTVQPYLVSWFKYDPSAEIKKLNIPVLIVQGTNDLQVRVEDAKMLHEADPASKMLLLEGMNHILRKVSTDKNENFKSYNDPTLPIDAELITGITEFIKNN